MFFFFVAISVITFSVKHFVFLSDHFFSHVIKTKS